MDTIDAQEASSVGMDRHEWPLTPGWLAAQAALRSMPTPCVVVDTGVVRHNLERAAQLARDNRVALRPHVKTHKSLRLSSMQREAGAAGLTAAKPTEAAVFLRAGSGSVTVAYPVLRPEAIRTLLAAAAHGGGDVRFVVDSAPALELIANEAVRAGSVLAVLVELDVGLRRCEDRFEMVWQFSVSAFRDKVTLSFDGLRVTMDRSVNVNTGAVRWPQLRGRAFAASNVS